MRFHATHRFDGPVGAVIAVLVDPAFHAQLDLPDLARPEVVDHNEDGDHVGLRLRYEFVGSLDPIAHRLLRGRRLTWLQELTVDLRTHTGRLTFAAEAEPERLQGSGDFGLTDAGSHTVRELDGDFVVRVPVVGGMAERRILPGVLRRLDIEAEAVNRRLRPSTDAT